LEGFSPSTAVFFPPEKQIFLNSNSAQIAASSWHLISWGAVRKMKRKHREKCGERKLSFALHSYYLNSCKRLPRERIMKLSF